MNSAKLIELSGRRFTTFSKMFGFILIIVVGVFVAFCEADKNRTTSGMPALNARNIFISGAVTTASAAMRKNNDRL